MDTPHMNENDDYAIARATVSWTYKIRRSTIDNGEYGSMITTFAGAADVDKQNMIDGICPIEELMAGDVLYDVEIISTHND